MKRKIYTTARERKVDQLIGFLTFPVVNVLVFAVCWLFAQAASTSRAPGADRIQNCIWSGLTQASHIWRSDARFEGVEPPYVDSLRKSSWLLPWVVNGIVLLLTFLFRPEIGSGYVVCIGVVMCAPLLGGALFLAACSTAVFAGKLLSSTAVFTLVFLGLWLAAVLGLGWLILAWINDWWRRE